MTKRPKLTTLKPRIASLEPRLRTGGGSWRDGKTTDERGYDYRWKQARLQHLNEHPLCVLCEQEGRATVATVVDHRIAHRGDMTLFWDRSNWQSMCKAHHDREKQREEQVR